MKLVVGAVAACLVFAACKTGDQFPVGSPAPATSPQVESPASSPTPSPTFPDPNLDQVSVTVSLVSSFAQPIAMAYRLDDERLFIAEKGGRVKAFTPGTDPALLLDISGEISKAYEQGLLGLAISRDGKRLYINYTDRAGDTHVDEYLFSGDGKQLQSRREVLKIAQPFVNHNGGNLVVTPDDLLWISLGDGGSQKDPQDNAQDRGSLLGKLLRINPQASGDAAYSIPADNPFRDDPNARPEVFSYGLRNPWRFSFDRVTNDLWIGDVGQFHQEEIDYTPAGTGFGGNYGWARVEGTRPVRGSTPEGAIVPLLTYPHSQGRCAIIGGYVYRGAEIEGLHGAYLFSDSCVGSANALVQEGGKVTQERNLGVQVESPGSFGEDADGNLYLLSLTKGLYRLGPA